MLFLYCCNWVLGTVNMAVNNQCGGCRPNANDSILFVDTPHHDWIFWSRISRMYVLSDVFR